MMSNTHHSRRGQALIIMLLVMTVSLTLGVAISSRVVTTLRQISYSAQSAAALSLAEAGVEEGLKRITDNPSLPLPYSSDDVALGDGKFNYAIENLALSPIFDKLSPIARDKAVQIDLRGYTGTTVDVCWVDSSKPSETANQAAMEITLVYLESGVYKLLRYAYDPVVTRQGTNMFSSPPYSLGNNCTDNGVNHQYRATVTVPLGTTPQLLRLRALYNTVPNSFAVRAGTGALPSQGVVITSTGFVANVQRRVEVTRSTPALSELFDFVIFSGAGL